MAGVLSQTLQSITRTKISQIEKQRQNFQSHNKSLDHALAQAASQHERIRILLDGLESLGSSTLKRPETSDDDSSDDSSFNSEELKSPYFTREAEIYRNLIDQAESDPSISSSLLSEWESNLRQTIEVERQKLDYASLYSQLVTEWLTNTADASIKGSDNVTDKMAADGAEDEAFEPIGREEMHEQRKVFEPYVFNARETDTDAIKEYLTKLFASNRDQKEQLKRLRQSIKRIANNSFSSTPHPVFDEEAVKQAIKGLLKLDSLTEEKRMLLREFKRNSVVLSEIANVLNLRLAALEEWTWGTDAVLIEQRRALNGRYRFYTDEDVLEALFLHYIGLKWAVELKNALFTFFKSAAWTRHRDPLTKLERERREYFLREKSRSSPRMHDPLYTISGKRERFFEDYFLTQLPDQEDEGGRGYDGGSDDEDDEDESTREERERRSPIALKQSLLHALSTEALVEKHLHGSLTVIQSDFKWFGPSMPHSTVLAVLEFFGVPQKWVDFFRRFLEAPLQFKQDGPDGQTRIRKRGLSNSHVLSDVFGEAVMFCLDYAVNQKTSGNRLYRMHDDFWFWGRQSTCDVAWSTITHFTELMGLDLNDEKTAAVRIAKQRKRKSSPEPQSDILPYGQIKWGFLRLDAETGEFVISQDEVDKHICELKLQLDACKSVFAWIKAWNTYVGRFFVVNFGKPANCFGRKHVDNMIETLVRIQHAVFANNENTGVTEHVRKMVEARFGVRNLPDGFIFFPMCLGGLGVTNPFVELFAQRGTITKLPENILTRAYAEEEERYRKMKKNYDTESTSREPGSDELRENLAKARLERLAQPKTHSSDSDISSSSSSSSSSDDDSDSDSNNDHGHDHGQAPFMSFAEYTAHREYTSAIWARAYTQLLQTPSCTKLKEPPLWTTLSSSSSCNNYNGAEKLDESLLKQAFTSNKWNHMSPYWRGVVAMYGPDTARRFGGLAIVNKELLPQGMIGLYQAGRAKWLG